MDPKDDPSDLNEMKRRFAAKMEQVGGSQSAIDYYNRSFEAYLSDKPLETEMRFQAEQIFHQIAKEKVTYAHKVAITLQT